MSPNVFGMFQSSKLNKVLLTDEQMRKFHIISREESKV